MEDVKESEDNEILFEKLRESYKIMTSKHLTKINEWLKNLVKIEYTVGGVCFILAPVQVLKRPSSFVITGSDRQR
jgi:hypothetical protein